MPFYRQQGELPSKKHITFYKPDGKSLYREELTSTQGFSGIFSTKYHLHEPTRVLKVKEVEGLPEPEWEEAPLTYYHFHTDRGDRSGNFFSARDVYLQNNGMAVAVAHVTEETDAFFRNAYAHECIFVHYGKGTLLSDYGNIPFVEGDHLVIPKGVTYRLEFDDLARVKLLVMESQTPFEIPKRYRNEFGQILEHAPYCERDFKCPELEGPIDEMGEFDLYIKANKRLFHYRLDHHPFDVIGWDGFMFPYTFNIKEFNPIVGKIHLPPPIHQVFQTQSFVVCNFCPRLFDFHPSSVPAPYFHTNVDSCELIYYVEGDFMSRKGVQEGSMTLHPTGIAHGPQPGKTEESIGKRETNEYAVMVDSFSPMHPTKHVEERRMPEYEQSWLT